jgi:hypothetical protein
MNLDLKLALALVTAHLLADFVLQSDKDVANKKKPAVLGKHALIVAGLSYLLAGDWRVWHVPALIGLTHFLIDRVKAGSKQNGLGVFLLDQAAHLVVIAVVAGLSPTQFPVVNEWVKLWDVAFTRALIVTTGLILTTHVGGVVVGIAVRPYLGDLTKPLGPENKSIIAPSNEAQRGLMKGGRLIGQLERGLIFFLVMIGKPEAVAFLIAAKSIFRFGELKDRENRAEAEYITIGTLMSFTWGLVTAWATWRAFNLL